MLSEHVLHTGHYPPQPHTHETLDSGNASQDRKVYRFTLIQSVEWRHLSTEVLMPVWRKEDVTSCWGRIKAPIKSLENTSSKGEGTCALQPSNSAPGSVPQRLCLRRQDGRFTAELFVRTKRETTHMPINRRTENTPCGVRRTELCVFR